MHETEHISQADDAYRCVMSLGFFCTEDQNRQTGTEAQLHSVVLRLGALLVLMLTVGNWSDVFHVLIAFLGEATCLLPSQDLLQAVLKVCMNRLFLSQSYHVCLPFIPGMTFKWFLLLLGRCL